MTPAHIEDTCTCNWEEELIAKETGSRHSMIGILRVPYLICFFPLFCHIWPCFTILILPFLVIDAPWNGVFNISTVAKW